MKHGRAKMKRGRPSRRRLQEIRTANILAYKDPFAFEEPKIRFGHLAEPKAERTLLERAALAFDALGFSVAQRKITIRADYGKEFADQLTAAELVELTERLESQMPRKKKNFPVRVGSNPANYSAVRAHAPFAPPADGHVPY